LSVEFFTVSSLEKIFPGQTPVMWSDSRKLAGFKNETISFQAALRYEGSSRITLTVSVESPVSECIKCREVMLVPSGLPALQEKDAHYLSTEPGMFPDLLREISNNTFILPPRQWRGVWFDIRLNGTVPAGCYPVTIRLKDEEETELAELKTEITILDAELPEQKLIYTQWLHVDCLSDYYDVPVFSDAHWTILEKFIRTAVSHGINMMLTPLVTPPLDTRAGAERPTVQLLDICLNKGEYSFNFDRLKQWIDMCENCGIRYFEMNHLFTQWGAAKCPKIMAIVNGSEKRIFGWDTEADGGEYRRFLAAMLPALTEKLHEWGLAGRCWFHISDEPGKEHIDNYLSAKQMVEPYIKGFPVIDALSNIEFYDKGIVNHPICGTNYLEPFLEREVPELWTYYCSSQCVDVSNRFFSMPSARNRIIGLQLYKYGICGFLHWGYNFYNSQYSNRKINPYQVTDADYAFPSGDSFSVYPGLNGEPEESLRSMVFLHALQDIRALELLESLTDKDYVIGLLDESLETPLTFKEYPHSAEYILKIRERVNNEIAKRINRT